MNLLYWTSGRGTGHVKRANALLRGLVRVAVDLRLFVAAPEAVFPGLLAPGLHPWPRAGGDLDAVVLDHRLERFPDDLAASSRSFVHLCRINSNLVHPPALAGRTQLVSIEDCAANRELGLPYDGCLVDAGEEELLEAPAARNRLEQSAGRALQGLLGLSHANTAEPAAALGFLERAAGRLEGRVDTLVLSSGHGAVRAELQRRLSQRWGARLVVLGLHPIYPLYRAFDAGFFPCGYNTWCETQLFFGGAASWEPVVFDNGRPRFRDQRLRALERPLAGSIGNERIARRILKLVGGARQVRPRD